MAKRKRKTSTKKTVVRKIKKRRKPISHNMLGLFLTLFVLFLAYCLLGEPRQTILELHQRFSSNTVANTAQKGIIIEKNVSLYLWPAPITDIGPTLSEGERIKIITKNEKWAKIEWHGNWYWIPVKKTLISEI